MWLLGRPGIHIGASGVVFAYLGFLLLRGCYERSFGSVVLSLGVFSIFGGTLWGMVPISAGERVSWEGHLCLGSCRVWLQRRSCGDGISRAPRRQLCRRRSFRHREARWHEPDTCSTESGWRRWRLVPRATGA